MKDSELDEIIYHVLFSSINNFTKINHDIPLITVENLITSTKSLFDSEEIMLNLQFPIVVVGDIHGNLYDLIRIFDKCGYPPETKYLFLGDYVDRGSHSIEVLLLLFALKNKFPEHIYMLRGNHETLRISKAYGLYQECKNKYNKDLFYQFNILFMSLPITALINNSIFCVHGGISPHLHDLEEFRKLAKPHQIINDSIFGDLLWSDPSLSVQGFARNSRGCGVLFSKESVETFLDENNLKLLIRSHEKCSAGYKWTFKKSRCLTIFSSTDYCGHNNNGLVVSISADSNIKKAVFSPLPPEEKYHKVVNYPCWLLERKNDFLLKSPPPSDNSHDTFDESMLVIV